MRARHMRAPARAGVITLVCRWHCHRFFSSRSLFSPPTVCLILAATNNSPIPAMTSYLPATAASLVARLLLVLRAVRFFLLPRAYRSFLKCTAFLPRSPTHHRAALRAARAGLCAFTRHTVRRTHFGCVCRCCCARSFHFHLPAYFCSCVHAHCGFCFLFWFGLFYGLVDPYHYMFAVKRFCGGVCMAGGTGFCWHGVLALWR